MARRRRADTAKLILGTGVEMLVSRGLDGGCAQVRMADVLGEIERRTGERITNASVYGRIWTNQNEFHQDLLVSAAEYYPSGEEQATLDAAREVLDAWDLTTDDGRRSALREIARSAGAAHLVSLKGSRPWQTWLAIWAITVSTPTPDDDAIRGPAIGRRHHHAVRHFEAVLGEVLDRIGFQMKRPFTLQQLASSVYALSEGVALNDRFADEGVVRVERRTGHGASTQEWSLFSVGFEALLVHFTELDPGATFRPQFPFDKQHSTV